METGIFEAALSDTDPAAAKQQADRGQEAARTLARRSPTGVVVYADPKPLAKEFNENVVGTAQGGMNYHDCR